MKYEIYQLKRSDETTDLRFMSYDWLVRKGRKPEIKDYDKMYEGNIDLESSFLPAAEFLYYKFNLSIPEDFRGHSLSVSDIVVILDGDEKGCYYCDSVGFVTLHGFKEVGKGE